MFPRPRIIGFHVGDLTATIDWGWTRSRSPVPRAILENPYLTHRALMEFLAPLEPPRWIPHLTSAIWPQPPSATEEASPAISEYEHWRDTLEVEMFNFKEVLRREGLFFKVKAAVYGEDSHPLFKIQFRHGDVDCRRSDMTRFWSAQLGLNDDALDRLYSDASQLDKRLFIHTV